jgi:hypothetical protein
MKRAFALSILAASLITAPLAVAGPQQERMKACSKEAKGKGMKGAERKNFMKGCLRSKKTGAPPATEKK